MSLQLRMEYARFFRRIGGRINQKGNFVLIKRKVRNGDTKSSKSS